MRRLAILLAALAACVLFVSGCSSTSKPASGEKKESDAQHRVTESLVTNQPIPSGNYSQMRQTLIEVERAQIEGAQTTSFFFNQGVQDPVKSCPSIGTPIPNTASLTNPSQVTKVDLSGSGSANESQTIHQMDPNGIYVPDSSTGTYVLCVADSGKPYVSYWEGFVQTEYAPATWDKNAHEVKLTGAPTATFTKKR
jgi:hypothetical protein